MASFVRQLSLAPAPAPLWASQAQTPAGQCRAPAARPSLAVERRSSAECSTDGMPSTSGAFSEQQGPAVAMPGLRLAGLQLARLARQGKLGLRRIRRALNQHQESQWHQGFGSAVSTMGVLAMPTLPGAGLQDLLANRVFMAGFWAWFMAQFAKIFTKRYKKGVWDIMAMFEPGGMPSSHSSLCSGVTTAIALQQGLSSPLFAAAVAFSVIVMYDAMGVRRHAGKQAEVLNQVINELMDDHPVGGVKLKEVLGHTPRQVVCGAILGVCVGLFFPC